MNKDKLKTLLRSLIVKEEEQLTGVSYIAGGNKIMHSMKRGAYDQYIKTGVENSYKTKETINIEGMLELLANLIDEEKLKKIME